MNFTVLPWDTDLFGFTVARLDAGLLSTDILNQLFDAEIELAYFSSEQPISFSSNAKYEIKLVDEKLTYTKEIVGSQLSDNILPYQNDHVEPALLMLALRSGQYSRFFIDDKIPKEKFKAIYEQWIMQSVAKKIASQVLVCHVEEILAGFVTVGHKNKRADIGIIAVDEAFGKRGIGKALVNAAENYSSKIFSEIQVVTQRDNIPACKLYESCGFKIEKREYFYHLWKKD